MRDSYRQGKAETSGRLFARYGLFRATDEDTLRSAAGRAALESVFAPGGLLPSRGLSWRAEDENRIVARWTLEPETVELFLQINEQGALRSAMLRRWGDVGDRSHGYVPCGATFSAEQRFGDLVIPSRLTAGWWFDTVRYKPFFMASILAAEAVD